MGTGPRPQRSRPASDHGWAGLVEKHAERVSSPFHPLYGASQPVLEKIETVARSLYGAKAVRRSARARRDLAEIERLGYADLPICIAKIPGSLSDDGRRRPGDFEVSVRELQINAGAGFLVVLTGDIVRMPGLPRRPLAERIDLEEGRIVGIG